MTGVIIEAFNGSRGIFGSSKKRANSGCDATNNNISDMRICKDPYSSSSNSNSSRKSMKQSWTDDKMSATVTKICRNLVNRNKCPTGNASMRSVITVGETESESSPAATTEETIGPTKKTILKTAVLEQAKYMHDHDVEGSANPTEPAAEEKFESTANAKKYKIDDAKTDSEVLIIKNPGSPEKDEIIQEQPEFSPPDGSPSDPTNREKSSRMLDGAECDGDSDIGNHYDKRYQNQAPPSTAHETPCPDSILDEVIPQHLCTESEHVPDQTKTEGAKSTSGPQKKKRALSKISAKIIAIPRSFHRILLRIEARISKWDELNWDHAPPQQKDPNKIKAPSYIRRIGTEFPMKGDGLLVLMTEAEKLEFAAKMRKRES